MKKRLMNGIGRRPKNESIIVDPQSIPNLELMLAVLDPQTSTSEPAIPKVITPPASFQGTLGSLYTDENTGGKYIFGADNLLHLLA